MRHVREEIDSMEKSRKSSNYNKTKRLAKSRDQLERNQRGFLNPS